jgi:hypothetical protein
MSAVPPASQPSASQPSASQPLAPPLLPAARRASRGLVIGLVAGSAAFLALLITVGLVIVSTLLHQLDEPHYAADAPVGLQDGPYPTGFEASDEFESGTASGPSDPLDPATPEECTDLYFMAPESNVGSSDYSTFGIASGYGEDDSYVDAYARVFDSAGAAKSFVAHTSDMVAACADGYWIPSEDGTYETSAVLPATIPTDVETVGWSEPAPEGDEYDFTAADFRIGNLVVRASCTADATTCTEFWAIIESQMRSIETDEAN